MGNKEVALMAHLMRRAGFGASYDELEARVKNGYEATVEELLDPEAYGVPPVDQFLMERYNPDISALNAPPHASTHFMYHLVNT